MHNVCVASILGYLRGGETLKLLHSHSNACLTITATDQGEELQRSLNKTCLQHKLFFFF